MTVIRRGGRSEQVLRAEENATVTAELEVREPDAKIPASIKGPSQETGQALAIRVDAAAKAAQDALRRLARAADGRIDVTDRRQVELLRSLLVKAADAMEQAIAIPELRADEGRMAGLSTALGRCIGPLQRKIGQLQEEAAAVSNRMSQLAAQVSVAFDRLLAPAASLPATAGEFVPIREAVEIAERAHAKLERTVAKLEAQGRTLSKEAEEALFKAILANDRFGLIMSIDAGVFDFLPEHLAKAITRDHHGIHSDPNDAEINSTMKLLDDVEQVRALPIPLEEKIARLQHDYRFCVTNNLGDAILPLVLAKRIPELVEHGGIRIAMKKGSTALLGIDHLKRLAHFEDFGFFGSSNVIEGRKRSAPGQIVLRDLIHVVLANYQVFDELLAKYDVKGSDRFDGLSSPKQRDLVEEAMALVEENLRDYGTRLERAERFKSSVDDLKEQVAESHQSMRRHLEENGVSKEDLDTLEGRIFYFFANTGGGTFATWDAPSLVHKNKIQWNSIRFGEDQWGFVLAVPSGRTPSFLDTSMVKAFAPRFPKAIYRGDTLLFVFKPEDGTVPPAEMAKILAEELRRHEVPGALTTERDVPVALPTPGENVISHDSYLYDDDGSYRWTPERFADAQRFAREAYENAVQDHKYRRVVLVMGLPSSGKSTYVRENQDRGTLFVDDTLTTPEKRRPLIEIARAANLPIEAVWIDTPFEVCCARTEGRADREIPSEWMKARDAELHSTPPRRGEGLQDVKIVRPE
jgi:predicted kinase